MPQWLVIMLGVMSAFGLGGGSMWAYLGARPKNQATLLSAQATFSEMLLAQAAAFTENLKAVVSQQAASIAKLEARIETLEDENEQCRGENRMLRQIIDGLRRELIAHGVPLPPDPPMVAIAEVALPDGVTLMTGVRAHKRKRR